MSKTKTNRSEKSDEMRAEYDFRGAARGKFYKPLEKGYTVRIEKSNGATVVKHITLKEGTVMLAPDLRKYFPNSESVNRA
jgi:hypothetical protein